MVTNHLIGPGTGHGPRMRTAERNSLPCVAPPPLSGSPRTRGVCLAVTKVKKKHRFRNLQRKQGPLKRTAVGEKTLENKFPYVLKDHNLSEHGR